MGTTYLVAHVVTREECRRGRLEDWRLQGPRGSSLGIGHTGELSNHCSHVEVYLQCVAVHFPGINTVSAQIREPKSEQRDKYQ